jgi:hypothetical protein
MLAWLMVPVLALVSLPVLALQRRYNTAFASVPALASTSVGTRVLELAFTFVQDWRGYGCFDAAVGGTADRSAKRGRLDLFVLDCSHSLQINTSLMGLRNLQ